MKFHKVTDPKTLIRDREYLVAICTSGDHPMQYYVEKFDHLIGEGRNTRAVFNGYNGDERDIDIDDVYELPKMPAQYWAQQKE